MNYKYVFADVYTFFLYGSFDLSYQLVPLARATTRPAILEIE